MYGDSDYTASSVFWSVTSGALVFFIGGFNPGYYLPPDHHAWWVSVIIFISLMAKALGFFFWSLFAGPTIVKLFRFFPISLIAFAILYSCEIAGAFASWAAFAGSPDPMHHFVDVSRSYVRWFYCDSYRGAGVQDVIRRSIGDPNEIDDLDGAISFVLSAIVNLIPNMINYLIVQLAYFEKLYLLAYGVVVSYWYIVFRVVAKIFD